MFGNVWKCLEMFGHVWKCVHVPIKTQAFEKKVHQGVSLFSKHMSFLHFLHSEGDLTWTETWTSPGLSPGLVALLGECE